MTPYTLTAIPDRLRSNAVQIIEAIAAAADRGDRCPTTPELQRRGLSVPGIVQLAEAGLIRTEVYGRNWRVVWICQGPHRGKSTKPAPYGEPYKVIGPDRPQVAA
jgi:hypothetical protein